jgi:hypothetical protein
MKSLFASAKALATATSPKATAESEAVSVGNVELLSKAEYTLQMLRRCEEQNFPLLNEATRLGRHYRCMHVMTSLYLRISQEAAKIASPRLCALGLQFSSWMVWYSRWGKETQRCHGAARSTSSKRPYRSSLHHATHAFL